MSQQSAGTAPVTTFRQAVDFLESALNYEKTRSWSYNSRWFKLARMEALLEELGNPHRGYGIFHVAGTKGKGSTAGAIAHALRRSGHRTGLWTKPHLVTPCERAVVDGQMIPEEDFVRIMRRMQPYVEARRQARGRGLHKAPTYFELLTALAFTHFAERRVDWAVVEVGLGGRLDSTNVVQPTCCVVTAIALEHTDRLGDTPEAIAGEKAGIFKAGVPVVIGRQRHPTALETLRRAADERGCPRWEVDREVLLGDCRPLAAPMDDSDAPVGWGFSIGTPLADYPEMTTPLLGAHQLENLAAALGAIEMTASLGRLDRDTAAVAGAVAEFTLPGRVEVLQRAPGLILDVAHTVESVQALMSAAETHFPGRRLHVVFGCSADKNVEGMLEALRGRCASLTATQHSLPRALPAAEAARHAARLEVCAPGDIRVVPEPWQAVQDSLAAAHRNDIVCVTGSFFVAGEVRGSWSAVQAGQDPDDPAR